MIKRPKKLVNLLKLSKARQFNNLIKISKFDNKNVTSYNKWPIEWKTIYYKAYPRFEQVFLPTPSNNSFDLYKTLLKRESSRDFFNKPVKVSNLSDLLYYSVGMKKILNNKLSNSRMYPSAGGRYPLEIYPFIFNVDQVKDGVYHYHFKTHSLEMLLQKPILKEIVRQFQTPWIKKTGILLVVSAVFDRSEMKYGDRGYRHILTEYGHLAQNVYLVGAALGLGVCSIGGFIDDGLNEIIDIDGRVESVIGVVAVGTKQ